MDVTSWSCNRLHSARLGLVVEEEDPARSNLHLQRLVVPVLILVDKNSGVALFDLSQPPALVVLGRDVGGDGLALAEGKVPLLK